MTRALLASLAAWAALLLVTGCGGAPDELSREDARDLAAARAGLDDAIDTEETLRTSRAEARRIVAEVRRILSDGSLESNKIDEFGLAALGELQQVVPSLVVTSFRGTPRRLDAPTTREFLRHALTDPARALLRPARFEVDRIERVVKESDAGAATKVRPGGDDTTAGKLLREAERDLRPIWPDLAERLAALRSDLGE